MLPIFNETLAFGQQLGLYTYYGVAVKAGLEPLQVENWLHFDFKAYTLK